MLTKGKPVSLRGLSAVNNNVIWVSGSDGTVVISTDGGKNWKWTQIPGYEKSDFRDIEAFNDREAVIMGITEPAVILITKDGGLNWETVFKDSAKSVFLDAMDFMGNKAVAIGDPVLDKNYILESNDRGKTWKKKEVVLSDSMESGEAFFAASGSNVRFLPGDGFVQVSGGIKSRLFTQSKSYVLHLNQGAQTTGANSIALDPAKPNEAFIVGGDFSHDTLRYKNSLHIQFYPFVQNPPETSPHGYRSCVEYLTDKLMVCCGNTGVDISYDSGKNWELISNTGFHICRKAKYGSSLFLAGPNGTIAQLKF